MGGVEFSTLYLAQHLDDSCWIPLVICPREGDLPVACQAAGVPVRILERPTLYSSSIRVSGDRRVPNPLAWVWNMGAILASARNLVLFLKVERPSLIVTKGLFAHIYGGLAARWAHIPCTWHLQDFISERFLGVYRRVFGLLVHRLPSKIIVDGSSIARQLPESIQNQISVIFNGVDTDVFRPGLDGRQVRQELEIPLDALVIGHVARLTPWKGQHYLLDAFAYLASENPQSYLLLVGAPVFDNDTYERLLRRRSVELGLQNRVIFAGFRRDLPQVLASMDIFAYSSVEKDTSPLVLLSAMAAGLPVVAFDIEGVREVIGDQGLLVPVAQTKSFSDALGNLLVDENLRRELSSAARLKAISNFSLKQYVLAMQEIFATQIQPGYDS
ncbi:MAG: glycosyltransferase [Anaerolineales bacterium]|nr:glycosyltransferase [Anaerolineales bacterium]